MIRTPLRPLAKIISARAAGRDPGLIEAENLRSRHKAMREAERHRAESRLVVLGLAFFAAFLVIGVRMTHLAASQPSEPVAEYSGEVIYAQRADILDRNGNVLATNLVTNALYAQPPLMADKAAAARGLVKIFTDMNEAELLESFQSKRKFIWLKRKISPEQQQAVHDLGEPGLLFGPREMRLYPNGRLAAHVLGGAGFGYQGVRSAEIVGIAGVEHFFNDRLNDPGRNSRPLELSIDLTIQAVTERVLAGGMKLLRAKGAAAILMDVNTGEVVSLVSLPDFDPNQRPAPLTKGQASDSPLFNRASQGLYELGSTFKVFTAAMALDLGVATPQTMIDTSSPLEWGKYKIKDFDDYGDSLSLSDVIVKSSNTGTARLALEVGSESQQKYLEALGLFSTVPLETPETSGALPLLPKHWSEISTITVSYGHGISVSPLHLASAYATLLNGGTKVTPTLMKLDRVEKGPRIVREETSLAMRAMLRKVVTKGTASMGEVPGYQVGGKTGSAEKPKKTGGYQKDKLISTFASVFPAQDPKYVLVVMMDEPSVMAGNEEKRTAGWTAVPVVAEIIGRIAPLMGLRPDIETGSALNYTLSNN